MDLVAEVDESLLDRFAIRKLLCTTIPVDRSIMLGTELADGVVAPRLLPGGCGANMASWLARLGSDTAVVAPFGNDSPADLARGDLEARGVRIVGFDYDGPHSVIYTLITSDRERTFADYCHGVDYDLFDSAARLAAEKLVSIDGYLLLRPGATRGVRAYLEQARPAGQQIVFCPGDVSVLADAAEIAHFILQRSDHLLINRNEAAALFPGLSDEQVATELRTRGISGAITQGEHGAFLFNADEWLHIPSASLGRPIANTNGAGDAFASGYVHGIDKGMPLDAIATLATQCAAEILMTEAARPALPVAATA